jgi:hypothetical protein
MKDIKIYWLDGDYYWYDRRERAWFSAPGHAWDTTSANLYWPERNRPIVANLPGCLVRRAPGKPKGVK